MASHQQGIGSIDASRGAVGRCPDLVGACFQTRNAKEPLGIGRSRGYQDPIAFPVNRYRTLHAGSSGLGIVNLTRQRGFEPDPRPYQGKNLGLVAAQGPFVGDLQGVDAGRWGL